MSYRVILAPEAEDDLIDIYRYVALSDSMDRADSLLDQIEARVHSLAELPERGHVPPELESVGVGDIREVHVKPYRVVYRVAERKVFVMAVLDGRRDLRTLLLRRLLR